MKNSFSNFVLALSMTTLLSICGRCNADDTIDFENWLKNRSDLVTYRTYYATPSLIYECPKATVVGATAFNRNPPLESSPCLQSGPYKYSPSPQKSEKGWYVQRIDGRRCIPIPHPTNSSTVKCYDGELYRVCSKAAQAIYTNTQKGICSPCMAVTGKNGCAVCSYTTFVFRDPPVAPEKCSP